MIRLGYFVDSFEIGGSELNAIRTLEGIDRTRFDPVVFHLGGSGPLLDRYRCLRVPMYRLEVQGFARPQAFVRATQFMRLLRQLSIQILHSHDIYSNVFSLLPARFAGVPVTIGSRRWLDAVPSRWHRIANRQALRAATAVLANSHAVASAVVKEDGISEERVRVVPNFLDHGAFAQGGAGQSRDLRSRLGIPQSATVVGCVARLAPEKNHSMLIAAAAEMCPRDPLLHFVLVGEGVERRRLEEQVDRLGLRGRVHLAGRVPERPNPHCALDISVLCSWTEGSPNSVLEAMAAGVPVVATNVGGVGELLAGGQCGMSVPPGDTRALERALEELRLSAALRQRIGASGRARARSEYGQEMVLRSLEGWYASLLDHARQ